MIANYTGRQIGVIMHCQSKIRSRKAGEQAIVEHGFSSHHSLFRRLADQYQCAVPLVAA